MALSIRIYRRRRASDRGRHLPKVKLLLDPNPDLTEPPSWPSPQTRCLPGGNSPSRAGPPAQAGGQGCPRARVAVERPYLGIRSAGHVWLGSTLKLGSIQHAGRSLGLPEAGKVGLCSRTRCSSIPQALLRGERDSLGPESGVGLGRRSRIPERLSIGMLRRERAGGHSAVQGFAGEAGVAMVGDQRSLCPCPPLQEAGGRETQPGGPPCCVLAR